MAKQSKRPAFTHCKVKQTSNVRAPWRVWFATEKEGKPVRVFKSFADERAAYRFAQDKELEISNHGVRYGDIPPEVRRAFDFYRDEQADLLAMGAEVPRFEDLVSSAMREIRVALKLATESDLPLAEVVAEFISYKTPRVKSRQLANLRDHLKRFAQDYGTSPISSITTATVEKWLSSLRSRRNPDKLAETPFLSPLSRNHYRATLHALFAYASAPTRALCPLNPVSSLEPEQVEAGEPQAYSPEDAAKIMQAALDSKPDLVPVLALGFFAGLRVSEAQGFNLAKLDRIADEFRLSEGKTGPRIVPFTDACKVWMAAQTRRKGKAWLKSARTMVDEMAELFTLAKVDQIDNGARHSFISYRCAETGDVAQVADDAGNSPGTIKKHYRSLVTKAAASTFFAIRPELKSENITGIEEGRKSA
jgi:integrase